MARLLACACATAALSPSPSSNDGRSVGGHRAEIRPARCDCRRSRHRPRVRIVSTKPQRIYVAPRAEVSKVRCPFDRRLHFVGVLNPRNGRAATTFVLPRSAPRS